MSFTLTEEHVKAFLEPAGRGDCAPFIDAIDPNVKWVIVDPVADSSISAGTYVCPFGLFDEIIWSHENDGIYKRDGKGCNPKCGKITEHVGYEV